MPQQKKTIHMFSLVCLKCVYKLAIIETIHLIQGGVKIIILLQNVLQKYSKTVLSEGHLR